jgi:D-alanyl-D-alanine carboxypeptidase
MSDTKKREPIELDMLFDVASVGKTFTAALVLQLAEEGKLALDDPLHKWLPEFPHIDHNASIRQLLNHTSGISHFSKNQQYWRAVFADPDSLWAPEDVLALVPEPRFPPGGGWNYSSTNYVLLGMIVERAESLTLGEQLRARLLVPLKLTGAFTSIGDGGQGSQVFAHGHFDLDGDGDLDDMGSVSRNSFFSSVSAAGPVVSTAKDLAQWAEYLYGGRILRRESRDEMTDFYRPTPGEPFISGYGLGTAEIQADFLDGERVWGHLGWNPGYMTAMLYFPDRSVSLVVLINDNNEKCISSVVAGLWSVVKDHIEPNRR